MENPVEYELEVPRGRLGRAFAKAFKAELKTRFGARRVVIRDLTPATFLIGAVVEKSDLKAVREAVDECRKRKGIGGLPLVKAVEASAPRVAPNAG